MDWQLCVPREHPFGGFPSGDVGVYRAGVRLAGGASELRIAHAVEQADVWVPTVATSAHQAARRTVLGR